MHVRHIYRPSRVQADVPADVQAELPNTHTHLNP